MSPAVIAATVFGLGRWRWGPGTLTSGAVALAAWLLGPPGPVGLLAAGVLTAAFGCWVAHLAESELGHDAGSITVDEAAGMLLALAPAPGTAAGFGLAFLLFRALDILKPPPVAALQRLPGGAGVIADDVGAALYTGLLFLLLGGFAPRLPWLFGTS